MYLRFTTLSLLGLILVTKYTEAANLTTTNIQAAGANWTATIWKTNSSGFATNGAAAVAPVAGNTYETVFNGIAVGNGLNNTRIRCPQVLGVQTFPGASLTLRTNTELRLKNNGAGGGGNTAALNSVDFPGVGGNPGLILNGGLIDGGDDGVYPMTGSIQVQSLSYISHGANGGGGGISQNRALNIAGVLSGSGDLVFMNAGTTLPQVISGNSNTFSGQWIVQCGWLQGTGNNSLGTNNNIVVDPGYTGFLAVMPAATSPAGPARFEPNYDMNSAGTLILTNAGTMRLHQNCIFGSVVVEGTALTAGTHPYCELAGAFPNNFPAGGSGTITVRPYSLAPLVGTAPPSDVVYAGGSARFTVGAVGPSLSYQWRKNTVNLTDGGNISGSSSATLVIANVSAGDAASYDVIVSNATSTATSAAGTLTILTPSETYETAIANALPYAFYQLNDAGDPAVCGTLAIDNGGGFNGAYGNTVQNGNIAYNIAGPTSSDGFPGFSAANKAASFINLSPGSRITLPALNLKTNTVTIMAWIKPSGPEGFFEGIVLSRGGDTIAGLNYSGSTDLGGNTTIGYTWNNEGETYNWNSGISAPANIWSLVALVVTPTNATIHLMNTNGMVSATHTYPHVVQSFNGITFIGADSADGGNGARGFAGVIDDVAIFNRALSKTELAGFFSAASGVSTYAPIIVNQPSALNLYAGQTAQFNVAAGGSEPLTYQWQKAATGSGVYNNVTDGGQISGAQSGTLTIGNIGNPDAADYIVIVANGAGSVTSVVANLGVQSTIAGGNITMAIQQAVNLDWDTTGAWSDGQAASVSAASAPGNTYELLAGSRMRTPIAPRTANFPGSLLKVDGSGVWVNNPAAGNTTIAEVRFKQPTLGVGNGVVNFTKLVMNGGQLDLGGPGLVCQVGGEIDILTNAPFYNDSANDIGYLINAWLTGGSTSSIEYHGYNIGIFQTSYSNNLNIAGTSNTFSGKWNVVVGTLLGTGPNSLGTNDITVAAGGALETTYDVNNSNANLFLTGRMFLHQNDTFKSLFVNGVPLNPGTYTFAQLNATYPNNFPATWTLQNGSSANTGSGSITVLVQPAPTIVQQPQSLSLYPGQSALFSVQAQGNPPLGYRWRKGTTLLTDNPNLIGSTSTNLSIPSVTPGDAGNYTVVVSNGVGSVTSIVATLTVLPTGPTTNLTLDYGGVPVVQPAGNDWNTPTNWIDGNPASVSVYANPGSSYDVVIGSRLRPPAGTNFVVFPGNVLKVEGSGVFENSTLTAVGEFRFKHPDPGTNVFPKLVLSGGQLDNGDNGNMVLIGEVDVISNSVIYVDSAAGVDRGVQINAWLTGSGDLIWSQWGTALGGPDLNITGTSNTFSGRWNVAQGTLLGSGTNSLGTNDMIVGATGALETLYDINNPNGSLTLDGQMFLHQNDTFKNVTVAGTPLSPGTYTFAQLSAAYPLNFPATWTLQAGSSINTGSGSITVGTPISVSLGFSFNGSSLTLTWSQGILLEANDVTGPWTTNLTASPPSFIVNPTAPRKFYRIQVQ